MCRMFGKVKRLFSTGFTVWHKIVPDFNHSKVHVIINIDNAAQYNKWLCCAIDKYKWHTVFSWRKIRIWNGVYFTCVILTPAQWRNFVAIGAHTCDNSFNKGHENKCFQLRGQVTQSSSCSFSYFNTLDERMARLYLLVFCVRSKTEP